MNSGLYSAATGMVARALMQDVIGRNIANVNTTGFKRERVVFGDFAQILEKTLGVSSTPSTKTGTYVNDVVTDFSQGSMKNTGNSYDMAIHGEGFFAVQDPKSNNIYYTRDGAFQINGSGELVTKEGYLVMGEGGRITIPLQTGGISGVSNSFGVAEDGSVYAFNGNPPVKTPVGKLKIVSFNNLQGLEKGANGYYLNTGSAGEQVVAKPKVEQGVLEMANFGIVDEMVNMISNNRLYDTGQVVLKTIDQSLGNLFSVVG
jgi:flagellar basal-body rod protein FlgF